MSLDFKKSANVIIEDYEVGIKILRSKDFGVDHPFRATRQIFGPSVLDIEGKAHIERKRVWMSQFQPKSIATPEVKSIIAEATREGFKLAEEKGDLLVASVYIPNRVLLNLLGLKEICPLDHFKHLRPITDFLESNERNPAVLKARAYLHTGPFKEQTTTLFTNLDPDQQKNELFLFSYAAAETTMVALKCLILFWAAHNHEFRTRIAKEGIQPFLSTTLREDPPLGIATRYCKNDVEINGIKFRKGDLVHVNIVECNKKCPIDEGRRYQADLTFGAGQHSCPGHLLAKAELEAVVGKLSALDAEKYQIVGDPNNDRPVNFRDPGNISVRPV